MIPAVAGSVHISKANEPHTEAEKEEMRSINYHETAGALVWASAMTRLDISMPFARWWSFAMSRDRPTTVEGGTVKVLQYLLRTQDQEQRAFCISVTGGAVPLGGGGLDRLLVEDPTDGGIVMSSFEAQNIALMQIVKEVLYLLRVQ